jgi:uncharacterized protein Yka (UPF0111/DUF47 family)
VLLFASDVVHGHLPNVSKTVVAGAELLITEARACTRGELIVFDQKMQGLRGRAEIQKSALFEQLCHTLITPFDHDDLFLLSKMLGSTMDEILGASEILRSWPDPPAPDSVQDLCRVVGEACHAVDRTVRKFLDNKLEARDFRDFFRIRDKANEILNLALGRLFETETDSTILLQKRDLYKHPHAAVALCCQTAASLRSIVLKNG